MWEGSAGGKKDQAESLRTDHAMIELISAYNPGHLMVHWVVPPHLLSLVLLRNLLRRGATVACVGRTSRLLRVVDAVCGRKSSEMAPRASEMNDVALKHPKTIAELRAHRDDVVAL